MQSPCECLNDYHTCSQLTQCTFKPWGQDLLTQGHRTGTLSNPGKQLFELLAHTPSIKGNADFWNTSVLSSWNHSEFRVDGNWASCLLFLKCLTCHKHSRRGYAFFASQTTFFSLLGEWDSNMCHQCHRLSLHCNTRCRTEAPLNCNNWHSAHQPSDIWLRRR